MKIPHFPLVLVLLSLFFISCTSKSERRKEIKEKKSDNHTVVIKHKIKKKKDKEAPIITIFTPKTNSRGLSVVKNISKNITVSGNVKDKSGIKDLLINKKQVSFDRKGDFNTVVSLLSNEKIEIEATDKKNNTAYRTIIITKKQTPVYDENQQKFALVIGNSDYDELTDLRNTVNDANAMASSLKKLGFKVFKYTNLNQSELIKKIDSFGDKLTANSVSLFYYAGHGLQVNGINYLLPKNAAPKSEEDIEYQCVKAGRILAKMENAACKVNILILDACRNNPFKKSWSRDSKTQGLAAMNAPAGTIISFSADANQTAADGNGQNGLFTEELLKNMQIPNLKIEEVFKKTRIAVMAKSGNKQEPAEYNKMTGDFYFKVE
jgi:hypothetical protein